VGDDDATAALTVASAPPPPDLDDGRPVVAGYSIVGQLGRGGMGVVWEALELKLDRKVAIKVQKAAKGDAGLLAEALVAARIGDPSIVRVFDVGYTLDERTYYAMELVDGTSLAALVAEGPIAPRRAVAIAADVARAAAAAHEHGVIHRDLKPHNVIVDPTGRARVLDFGIACRIDDGDVAPEGLTGSPAYMAPEQVTGDPITPRTDIFAIGVILYEMLTGRRPFQGDGPVKLLEAIVRHTPEPPSAKNPSVHADLDAVVLRCLDKSPAARFPSARALFETLQAIAEGRAVDTTAESLSPGYTRKATTRPPPDKPRRDDARKHLAWKWTLGSSPAALWPYVANTDRFNKAVGLGPVAFTDEPLPQGGTDRTGELRVLGLPIRWREYPFEWVKEREHSVFRWYRSGPIAALWNEVSLTPLPDGGTELRHEIWLTPRGVIGQVAAFVELERKLGPAVDRFYRHLDEVLRSGSGEDPFEAPHAATSEEIATVDDGARQLVRDGFPRALVERLTKHILSAPDAVIGTIRPYELAAAWGISREEALDLFVHAAHARLLEPAWDVVCPKCMLAHESVHALAHVTRVGTCTACASSFERDLHDSVELAFAVPPAVRKIERATYCAGAPGLRPHIVAQQVLDPGEERVVVVDLPRGEYQIAGTVAKTPWPLVVSAVGFEVQCEVTATPDRITGRPELVRAGPVTFTLRNDTGFEETLRVEVPGARSDGVSAATALTLPAFRDFFSEQLLARNEHLRVSQMAFLFVAPANRETMFRNLGDAAACAELSRVEAALMGLARKLDGTAIPSSLDTLVFAFPVATKAVSAALALREQLANAPPEQTVSIAVHGGRCIALTREGRSEFFGETLDRGRALLDGCPHRGIAVSAALAADRAVSIAMHSSGLRISVTSASDGRRITVLTPP
jgi:serine/threonine protein kinase